MTTQAVSNDLDGAAEEPIAQALREETYSIRDLCDRFEVTPRTLRFYETQGLLTPERDGRTRIYSAKDRGRLKLILRGKRFGFSLAEIGELLSLYELGDGQVAQLTKTLEIAETKRREMAERLRELSAAIDDLDAQIALVADLLAEKTESQGAAKT